MCFCTPGIRTPFCESIECQLELERRRNVIKRIRSEGIWQFPKNGDFPEIMRPILYVPFGSSLMFHGYLDGAVWLSYTYGETRPTTKVKCWMYAPEIPEHYTKKG